MLLFPRPHFGQQDEGAGESLSAFRGVSWSLTAGAAGAGPELGACEQSVVTASPSGATASLVATSALFPSLARLPL